MNRQTIRMRELFAIRPEALPAVTRIEELSLSKFAEMDETIALKRNRQDEEALALFRSNRGKAIMDGRTSSSPG
jgi:CHASE3 domain sensor protein